MAVNRKKVVIIGANFAGLTAAIELPKTLDVTVIDPSPHFEWIPAIHEILSGVKTQRGLQLDRAQIIAHAGHRFVQDSVTDIDTRRRHVTTFAGETLAYDVAIVAVGGVTNNYHIPGVDSCTWPFRTVADSLAIEQRFDELRHMQQSLQVVVVGGGISGVEALGELLRSYRDRPKISFALVEASNQLMPGFPKQIDVDLRRICQEHNVSIYTGDPVERITPKGVFKEVRDLIDGVYSEKAGKEAQEREIEKARIEDMSERDIAKEIKRLEKLMMEHARNLEFENAARVRDQLSNLRAQAFGGAGHDNVVV